MLTLSYGYKKPQTRDSGSTLWTALEDNIQRVNDHTHNGVNSSKITTASVTATTQSVPEADWVSTSQGNYRQLITLSGLLFDEINIDFRNESGHPVFLEVEKVSSTTYYVYTNDNSMTYTAVYTS